MQHQYAPSQMMFFQLGRYVCLYHIISFHIPYHTIYFPHITFICYKNIQIYCINIFLILNGKIHIGFSNEEGLAESHYGFDIKPLFVNRVLQTHGWNILKVSNVIAKRKQFKFQFRFKKRKWLNFFYRILEKVISDGGPSKWDSEFAFSKCGFRNFIVKLWRICWVSMRDFLKTSWKY